MAGAKILCVKVMNITKKKKLSCMLTKDFLEISPRTSCDNFFRNFHSIHLWNPIGISSKKFPQEFFMKILLEFLQLCLSGNSQEIT